MRVPMSTVPVQVTLRIESTKERAWTAEAARRWRSLGPLLIAIVGTSPDLRYANNYKPIVRAAAAWRTTVATRPR